jgi:hypothetical protein
MELSQLNKRINQLQRCQEEHVAATENWRVVFERKIMSKQEELNIDFNGLQRRHEELHGLVTGKHRARLTELHNDFEDMRSLFNEFQEYTTSSLSQWSTRCEENVQDDVKDLRSALHDLTSRMQCWETDFSSSLMSLEALLQEVRTDQNHMKTISKDVQKDMQTTVTECRLELEQLGNDFGNLHQSNVADISVATVLPSPPRLGQLRASPEHTPTVVKVPVSPIRAGERRCIFDDEGLTPTRPTLPPGNSVTLHQPQRLPEASLESSRVSVSSVNMSPLRERNLSQERGRSQFVGLAANDVRSGSWPGPGHNPVIGPQMVVTVGNKMLPPPPQVVGCCPQTPTQPWQFQALGPQIPMDYGLPVSCNGFRSERVLQALPPHEGGVQSGEEYEIILSKTAGTHLGIETCEGYTVAAIRSGLVSKWNTKYTDQKVNVGDRVVEVNGIRDLPRMRSECQKVQTLKIKLVRPQKSK